MACAVGGSFPFCVLQIGLEGFDFFHFLVWILLFHKTICGGVSVETVFQVVTSIFYVFSQAANSIHIAKSIAEVAPARLAHLLARAPPRVASRQHREHEACLEGPHDSE